jgi:hypothetical protein
VCAVYAGRHGSGLGDATCGEWFDLTFNVESEVGHTMWWLAKADAYCLSLDAVEFAEDGGSGGCENSAAELKEGSYPLFVDVEHGFAGSPPSVACNGSEHVDAGRGFFDLHLNVVGETEMIVEPETKVSGGASMLCCGVVRGDGEWCSVEVEVKVVSRVAS